MSRVIAFLIVVFFFAGISAFVGWLFMLMWNFVIPSTFNGPVLSFWKAWVLWIIIAWIGNLFRSNVNK